MAQPPSVGAKDLLVAASIGTFGSGAWPIYISKMPDTSDQCIALFDSGGQPPDPLWLLDYPDLSITVRGSDYLSTRQKAKDIKGCLLGLPSQTIAGDRWDSITMIGDLTYIGNDEKDRPMITMTFRLIIEPAPAVGDNRQPL